jgi:DNA polymerase V
MKQGRSIMYMYSQTGATRVTEVCAVEVSKHLRLPLFLVPVPAGAPELTEDYVEGKLDLASMLVRNPTTTFLVRVTGDSMVDAGIHSGDMLVVDQSIEASDGSVVIAVVNGELTVKRLARSEREIFLVAENDSYDPIEVTGEMQCSIWGVVTSVIHFLEPASRRRP